AASVSVSPTLFPASHKPELRTLSLLFWLGVPHTLLQELTNAEPGHPSRGYRDRLVRADMLNGSLTAVARIEGAKAWQCDGLAVFERFGHHLHCAVQRIAHHALGESRVAGDLSYDIVLVHM